MHLEFRNVNDAFAGLVGLFVKDYNHIKGCGTVYQDVVRRRSSRNGEVLVLDEPVTITYIHPRERVLLNSARDANPFSLLYESLFMLTGRNDVAPLCYYTKRFADYSDDGKTLNGSYGYRWRKHDTNPANPLWKGVDQLNLLVAHLKAQPESRRAVLQMWNVEDDLLKIGGTGNRVRCPECSSTGFVVPKGGDAGDQVDCPRCKRACWVDEPGSRDVACNLSVLFSLQKERRSAQGVGVPDAFVSFLDMTVTNRSNDLVWGLLGANYVTFSVLLEYMAARLGVEMGRYHHFSNNLHCYVGGEGKTAAWEPERWLAAHPLGQQMIGSILGSQWRPVPLVQDPARFEEELPLLVEQYSGREPMAEPFRKYEEPFLCDVAQPMFDAFLSHKRKGGMALDHAARVKDEAWRAAALGWLERRAGRYTVEREKYHGGQEGVV